MITEIIAKYHSLSKEDPHHRFKSWEHCYNFFVKNHCRLEDEEVFDQACLQLAFYLASWGMMRGGTFLLQKDYKVHQYFFNQVVKPTPHPALALGDKTYLSDQSIKGLNELIDQTKWVYQDNIKQVSGEETAIQVSDTLASKILLGVFGNVPAYDRFFIDALRMFGIRTQFDEQSLKELAEFYHQHADEFEKTRNVLGSAGTVYTPMKLIDMYFWQIGFMKDRPDNYQEELRKIEEFARQYRAQKVKRQIDAPKKAGTPGLTEEIRNYITAILQDAKEEGKEFLDIKSGDIHRAMNLNSRMPSVCGAMETLRAYRMESIYNTPSGKSSTKVNRYYLTD